MPRIRTIKPEFFRSPSTAKVEPIVRLFYQALWCWADDFGIGETNVYGLLGFAFPDSDEISAQDVRRFCADCAQHYGVTFYIVRERHYYAIKNWPDHQKTERREDRRKHPTPDDPDAVPDLQFVGLETDAQIGVEEPAQNPREICAGTGEQGNRGTGESTSLALVEGGPGGDPALVDAPAKAVAKTNRGTRIPDDFTPDKDTVAKIRAEFPSISNDDLIREHRKFCDYWQSVSGAKGTKLNWDATWRNWIRTAYERGNIGRSGPGGQPSKVDAKAAGWSELGQQISEREAANG